jgi:acyl-CoA reductase-like NAD-dependent aldehyde dehydrogenase
VHPARSSTAATAAAARRLRTRCWLTPGPPGPAACTKDEVDAAYAGAHAAQLVWAKTPLHARCALLHKVAALMRENKEAMAHCLVKEVSKPAKDSMTEVVRAGAGRGWARVARKGGRALQTASRVALL